MSPTLVNGDYILSKKPRSQKKLRAGFIYVLEHDRLGRLVKRLNRRDESGLWFAGDNPHSTPSEKIGVQPFDAVTGRALLAITPKGLRRL
ncbi:hypothetical protein LIHA111178_08925 [Litorimonas haliclonae]